MNISPHIAKNARYTIGTRIENKFLDLLELAREAYFTKKENKEDKLKKVSDCIFMLDALKFLVSVAWEAKLLSHQHCENIATKLNEVGKILGGWKNSLKNPEKKNRAL